MISVLDTSRAEVKWVRKEGMHLTLKFLGHTPFEKISDLRTMLTQLAGEEHPFVVRFSGLGAFPVLKKPRVLWIGVREGREGLIRLAKRVEDETAKLGYPKTEIAFSPHLTIGRVKRLGGVERLVSVLKEKCFISDHPFTVNRVVLFKSDLTSDGPIYEKIAQEDLLE